MQGRDALTGHLLVAKQAMENAVMTAAETCDRSYYDYEMIKSIYRQIEQLLTHRLGIDREE